MNQSNVQTWIYIFRESYVSILKKKMFASYEPI